VDLDVAPGKPSRYRLGTYGVFLFSVLVLAPRARNGKSTRFSRNRPSGRNESTSTSICVPFPSLSCSCSMFAYEKNRTARTLRGSCSNRSQVVRGIFRARTITTFGDRFVLVLHNRTCGVKRNGRNLVDEHGLREMCSCAYLFHTTRAKRKLRARARTRTRRKCNTPYLAQVRRCVQDFSRPVNAVRRK